ncbi:MAG: phosphodiester glycosidase family protein [Bacteroidales bacterium]|nr:phosphodiester glycosidase family protein [Bacteroidales bacterium]
MKKSLLIALLALLPLFAIAQSAEDSLTVVNADWNWTDLGNGAFSGSARLDLFGNPQYISIVKYPEASFNTQVLHAPAQLCNSTDSLARRVDALWAINGSYFDMGPIIPCTFFSIDGDVKSVTDPSELHRSDGLLIIPEEDGKRIEIKLCDTTTLETVSKVNHIVLSAGPMLIYEGESRECLRQTGFYTGHHNRTVIGKDAEGTVYMMVVDGRFKGEAEGMAITQLTALCRYLGMHDALNLDGGGSSLIWTSLQGTLNHPSDNRTFDHKGGRRVPNIVYVK